MTINVFVSSNLTYLCNDMCNEESTPREIFKVLAMLSPCVPMQYCFMFRLYCNVDDTLKFELFGSLPMEDRFDTKTLFLTNTYLDRILFSIVVPPPFYIFVAHHGIIEPMIHGEAVQRLSILKNPPRESEAEHYRLPRDWSLQLVLRFRPFVNEGDWYPMDEVIERDLLITFQDTHEQVCQRLSYSLN